MNKEFITMDTTIKKIRTIPLFSGLNEKEFDDITAISQRKEYKKGEIIFHDGMWGMDFTLLKTR